MRRRHGSRHLSTSRPGFYQKRARKNWPLNSALLYSCQCGREPRDPGSILGVGLSDVENVISAHWGKQHDTNVKMRSPRGGRSCGGERRQRPRAGPGQGATPGRTRARRRRRATRPGPRRNPGPDHGHDSDSARDASLLRASGPTRRSLSSSAARPGRRRRLGSFRSANALFP